MSSLALMRLLESAPLRYDTGIRLLTFGQIDQVREALAEAAATGAGACVLEIGCGTGALTQLLVARGTRVTALDQNPEMLEQARKRIATASPGAPSLLEMTASEIDRFAQHSFDAVVSCLSLSEMARDERAFVLRESFRVLRPAGVIAVADEVIPHSASRRITHGLARLPQAALGWIIVGAVSSPIPDLAAEVTAAGFALRSERRWLLESLALVVGERPP